MGRWQSTCWEWCKDIVISQYMVVYLVLDGNLEGEQHILGFKVFRGNKNWKIMLCQAYTLVSFENEGLCAFAPNCWDGLEGDDG